MENSGKTTCRVAIQLETGTTAKGKPAHRTVSLHDIRADITQEEVMRIVEVVRPMLAHPISSVHLVTQNVKEVWSAPKPGKTAERAAAKAAPALRVVRESVEPQGEPAKAAQQAAGWNVSDIPAAATQLLPKEILTTEGQALLSGTPQSAASRFPGVIMRGFLPKAKKAPR